MNRGFAHGEFVARNRAILDLPGSGTKQVHPIPAVAGAYRHRTANILSTHELDLDCDVPGRSQFVGKVQSLGVDIEHISAK